MFKLSIIIPSYNSYKYMKECLKSLENQTDKSFEVIIVDDCSKDDTYELLKRYIQRSQLDIKLYKTSRNSGPGMARNIGIENCKGNYLTFLDSDDYISLNFVEKMHNIIKKYELDCIIYDYYKINKYKKIERQNITGVKEGFITTSEAMIYGTGNVWSKVFKTNIVRKKVKFPDLIRNEDMVFSKIALSMCKTIYYYNKNLYFYVMQNESIMHTKAFDKNDIEIAYKAFNIIQSKLPSSFQEELEAIYIKEIIYATTIAISRENKSYYEIKKYILEETKRYPKWPQCKAVKRYSLLIRITLFFIRNKMVFPLKILGYMKNFI